MARYHEEERNQIEVRMKKEAAICMLQYGVRRTSIDELVKQVNIPKGTFYLFFSSKEDLLFRVICSYKEELLYKMIFALEQEAVFSWQKVSDISLSIFKEAANSFLAVVVANNEMDFLLRKLSADTVQHHERSGEAAEQKIIELLFPNNEDSAKDYFAIYKLLFKTIENMKSIGETDYLSLLSILIEGISLYFQKGEIHNDVYYILKLFHNHSCCNKPFSFSLCTKESGILA